MSLIYDESKGMEWRGFSSPLRDKAPMVRRNLGIVVAAAAMVLMAIKLQAVVTEVPKEIPAAATNPESLGGISSNESSPGSEAPDATNPSRNSVAEFLLTRKIADTWKVSADMARNYVQLAFSEGRERNVDPLLLLSIMAVESSFNPAAKSNKGAQGVMQVFRKWHREKFHALGIPDDAHPTVHQNVQIGTQILKEYLVLSRNDVMQALQRYNGNAADPAQRYANKVINMHKEFRETYRRSIQASLKNDHLKTTMIDSDSMSVRRMKI